MPRKYSALVPWDQSHYAFEFEPFEATPTKSDFNFLHLLPDPVVYEMMDNLVVLQVEFPNCLVGGDPNKIDCFKYDKKVKKIISNCPFSVEYFNRKYNYDKMVFGFSPFNPKYTPPQIGKRYEVYYTGHYHNSAIRGVLPMLNQYSACFVCADYGPNAGIGYQEKLALNAQSKISIVHGLLYWPNQFMSGAAQFHGHGAFSSVFQDNLVPQMKTRIMEAAASKSLIICLRDKWNMIESYFEKDRDFIYWENPEDLNEKIQYILSHYDEFQPMIEHAYETLMNNFTTEHFFEAYLKDL